MIEVTNLRKQYGDLTAVDDVSFVAQPGKVFGLLGPNGAGKSTTIGCISGLLKPTSGRVSILGHDVVSDGPASRLQLGVVPQELAIYEDLSAFANLQFWGAAYGLRGNDLEQRVNQTLDAIGLLDRAKEPCGQFSGGMKRRLNMGCALVHQPKVLLLDEPTVGVDPQSRVRLLDLVRDLQDQGTCVLYTTHYMEEAETLCDELAIIDHGKIIAAGTLTELRGQMGERDMLRLSGQFDEEPVRQALSQFENTQLLQLLPDSLHMAMPDASSRLQEVFSCLHQVGATVRETTVSQPSLESLFIQLTGKDLRE